MTNYEPQNYAREMLFTMYDISFRLYDSHKKYTKKHYSITHPREAFFTVTTPPTEWGHCYSKMTPFSSRVVLFSGGDITEHH